MENHTSPQDTGIRPEVSLIAKLSFVKTEIIWKYVSEKKGETEGAAERRSVSDSS